MRRFILFFLLFPILFATSIVGFLFWRRLAVQPPPPYTMLGQPFFVSPIQGGTLSLFTAGGQLRSSGNDLFLEFHDPFGLPRNVGNVTLKLYMNMPQVTLCQTAKTLSTSTTGLYRCKIEPQIAGPWLAHIEYSGPHGKEEAQFPVAVK